MDADVLYTWFWFIYSIVAGIFALSLLVIGIIQEHKKKR